MQSRNVLKGVLGGAPDMLKIEITQCKMSKSLLISIDE
jgi:hypothetical protein